VTAGALSVASGALAAPSYADMGGVPAQGSNGNGNGNAGSGSGSGAGSGDDYAPSGPSHGTVSGCAVVSTPSYIGLSCGGGGGEVQTVKEYFGVDKVKDIPACSHQELDQGELDALSYENTPGPDGHTWFWEYCLVDPKLDRPVRQTEVTVTIVLLGNDDKIERHELIDRLVELKNGVVPFPVAVATPSSRPRVGAWTSFVDGTDDHLTVAAGSVTLDAHVVGLTVKPLGESDPHAVSCAGTGYFAQRGETPEDHAGCWWQYANSSSGQSETTSEGLPAYPVEITATWAVDTVVNGVRTRFNTFQKSQTTPLPVTEIQALVVS
jgi:hypothetical protein